MQTDRNKNIEIQTHTYETSMMQTYTQERDADRKKLKTGTQRTF